MNTIVTSGGYLAVRVPEHPRASNGYVFEHIVVAERALGRFLPRTAEVHHVDEDKTRNVGGNLVICEDRSYHMLLHQRMNALLACGDPSALKCNLCGSYDRQADIEVSIRRGRVGRHKDCRAREAAERRRRTQRPRASRFRSTCFKGHPLTPENTYTAPKSGLRSCRICKAARARIDAPRAEITITPIPS